MNTGVRIAVIALTIAVLGIGVYWLAGSREGRQDGSAGLGPAAERLAKEIHARIDGKGRVVLVTMTGVKAFSGAIRESQSAIEAVFDGQPGIEIQIVDLGSELGAAVFEMGFPKSVFERVVSEHRDAGALISLIGLPWYTRTPGFSAEDKPLIAAVGPHLTLDGTLAKLLMDGYVDLVVVANSKGTGPENHQQDGQAGYHVVTASKLQKMNR